MKFIYCLFLLIICSQVSAQKIDYRKIKDTVCPSVCGWYNLETLNEIEPRMSSLDTNNLKRSSLQEFYYDFGLIEYEIYAYTMDTSHLRKSAFYYSRSAGSSRKSVSACYSAASQYARLGECAEMDYYFTLYLRRAGKRELTKKRLENLAYIKSTCHK